MPISRETALQILRARYPQHLVSAFEVKDEVPRGIYGASTFGECWVITFSIGETSRIGPSNVVCIAKATGEIIYEGSSTDEG
jgi:hypothetical protein